MSVAKRIDDFIDQVLARRGRAAQPRAGGAPS